MFRRKRPSVPEKADFLIVGLGNPGKKYELTRHNVGFLAVDLLCQKHAARADKLKHKALLASLDIAGKRVIALKPQTYMNLSGEAVRAAAAAFGVPASAIIVIFDDAALPAGRLRVRRSGSDGGHNGIKSIISHMDSDAFPRVKIGIGAPDRSVTDLSEHVLSDMDSDTSGAIKLIPDIIEAIVTQGVDAAMRLYNGGASG